LAPDANREQVASALLGLMTDPDIWVLGAATKALIVWGGAENVPGLIAVTTHHNIFNRGAAMDVAGCPQGRTGSRGRRQTLERSVRPRRGQQVAGGDGTGCGSGRPQAPEQRDQGRAD